MPAGWRPVYPTFWVWPDCVPVLRLWSAVVTQWRYSAGGDRTGLDYAGVEAALRMLAVPRRDWPDLFTDLRIMERSAMEAWRRRSAAQHAG